jgi:hypothetical protein
MVNLPSFRHPTPEVCNDTVRTLSPRCVGETEKQHWLLPAGYSKVLFTCSTDNEFGGTVTTFPWFSILL